ncbi:chaperone NapD [Thauera sinica]|uniref:Chaperone NapD n=1 Tax=Thauera sinica TaxID=2665146 RepID=A0ABW1AN68_9RHOO|nr:chaperone NapD [Thauera sp. K11]ATE61787.1 nitrate reductase [Thauera sp. K11]
MKVASLVVRAMPADFPEVQASLRGIPGVEMHGASAETGRIVVTVEDGEGWSVADSILAVNMAPKVHGVTLAYEYTDEGLEHLEA